MATSAMEMASVATDTPRILRGAIELPHERGTRAKAEAKRARRAARNLGV